MADSAADRDAEAWVRESFLAKRYKTTFDRRKAPLAPGGSYELDAVSKDGGIVAVISTAGYKTAGSQPGAGNMQKIRSDAFFLLLVQAQRKLLVFTEDDMYEAWLREQRNGRLPSEIGLLKADLTPSLRRRLDAAKKAAAQGG